MQDPAEVSEPLGLPAAQAAVKLQRELPLPRPPPPRARPPHKRQAGCAARGGSDTICPPGRSIRETVFPRPLPLNALRKAIPFPAGANPSSGSGSAHALGACAFVPGARRRPRSLGGDPVLGLGCGASGSPRPASGSGSDDSRLQADPSFAPSPASGPVNVSAGLGNSALPISPPLAVHSSPWGQGEGAHSCLSEPLSRVWKALKWC